MAKSEPAAPETSLGQAGMPQSYGMGIQQGSYGNGRNYAGGSGFGAPGQPGPMSGAGPSPNFLQAMIRMLAGASQGMNNFQRGMDQFGGQNGMGGPRGTGYNFGTPISGPSLFSGLAGVTGGSQAGQRLTDPNAAQNKSFGFANSNNRPAPPK